MKYRLFSLNILLHPPGVRKLWLLKPIKHLSIIYTIETLFIYEY